MGRDIADSLVSFWRDPERTHESQFVCSGVFVAECTILTVAHALGAEPIWARPHSAATQAFPVGDAFEKHPGRLDAALVFLQSMPEGAVVLPCESSRQWDHLARHLSLNGYFEGRHEVPRQIQVHSFDAVNSYFVSSPKHPRGHSGSAVCHGDRVWGIATEHYADPNTDRGCVIAVHQLWDWLGPRLGAPRQPRDAGAGPPRETPFRWTPDPATGASRAPIVIAIESADKPLSESELLRTERHLTITLTSLQLDALAGIGEGLADRGGLPQLVGAGRTAWRTLVESQPRLPKLAESVRAAGGAQPIAWSGRLELLMQLREALLLAHTGEAEAGTAIDGFLSVGVGASYFSPVDEGRGQWTVPPRSDGKPKFGAFVQTAAAPGLPADAGTHEVTLLRADDLAEAMSRLEEAIRNRAASSTRVTLGMGGNPPAAPLLRSMLTRVPCLGIGGSRLRTEALAGALEQAFGALGDRQAAACVVAAVRRAWLEHAAATGDEAALRDGLLWSTWSWVGRPLFARQLGDVLPAAYPHLMDLRSVAAEGWYFPRRKGVPDLYQADALIRSETPFHLYLSGAGGTGKSCFLRYLYERVNAQSAVLAVWYRVDAPSSLWEDVERRIIHEITLAAEHKWPAESRTLLPPVNDRLGSFMRELAGRLRAAAPDRRIVVFIDQLERTFESGDEPDHDRLDRISSDVIDLLETVKVDEGVRVFIASRKQYLPDFLKSFQAAADSGLHFNVLQSITDSGEQRGFVEQVVRWCQQKNLIEARLGIDRAAAETLARRVQGHPLNMMLALIQLLSEGSEGQITARALEEREPWSRLFDLDLQAVGRDEVDRYFMLAMAHARTEIVRFEEVWWRLRMVDPKLTRRVDEMRPRGVLERLWLLGHLGRTIHARPHQDDPARFLEFFHANLRDYLLREVMGQGGLALAGATTVWDMPAAWRALDRLSAYAHEWEQTKQLLPDDDVQALMAHRDVVVDRLVWPGEPEHEPFHLLFLRDSEQARSHLCRAARECFVFSALVHDEQGSRLFETLFPEAGDQIDCCRRWLRHCPAERRKPVLHHLVEMRAPAAREFLTTLMLPDTTTDVEPPWRDVATVLAEPLYAARYRAEVLAALLERAVAGMSGPRAAALPRRVGEFFAATCRGDRNELTQVLAESSRRLAASPAERSRRFAAELESRELVEAWLGQTSPADVSPEGDLLPPGGRIGAPVQLVAGRDLARAIDEDRVVRWRAEVSARLGVPVPVFEVTVGDIEADDLQLRVRGDVVAQGTFHPGRSQILKRHWDRGQPATPPEARLAQNDALQEVVLWVDADLLAQTGWDLPAADFDRAVVDWLEQMLRQAIDAAFDFDLLVEFLGDIARRLDRSRLFLGVSLPVLRQVLVNLLGEGVPIARRRVEIIEKLQHLVGKVKDPEVLTQKLREHLGEDLCRALADESGQLATLLLDAAYENRLLDQIARFDDGRALRVDPSEALALASAVRRHLERASRDDVHLVLVCGAALRMPLARMLRRFDSRIHVLSLTELSTEVIVVPAGLVAEVARPSPE